ncbi:MAG: hypothetical protein WD648_00800 [Planctomycetaceae bacterium]
MASRSISKQSNLGWLVSLLFWACLLVAVALFALTVLSPKVLAFLELEKEYHQNQVRLVRLERQVEYFDKVASALQTDAEFAKELARFEFDAVRPGEERIAVDRRLSLQASPPPEPLLQSTSSVEWYTLPLRTFLDDPRNRNRALVVAALLVIVAFAFLQEPANSTAASRPRSRR